MSTVRKVTVCSVIYWTKHVPRCLTGYKTFEGIDDKKIADQNNIQTKQLIKLT
jgi:hypothetical protein